MLEVGFRQYSLYDTPAVDCHINVIQDFFFYDILLFDSFPVCTSKPENLC